MKKLIFQMLVIFFCAESFLWSAELYVGRKTVDITPSRPVMIQGQMHTRISNGIDTPITANILSLASKEGDKMNTEMFIVSMDLCIMTREPDSAIRSAIKKRLPDLDVQKSVMLSTTHTHTAPCMTEDYITTEKNIMTPSEYTLFLADKVAEGIVAAKANRQPVDFSFALEYAAVGFNRRSVYTNGQAVMYGKTDQPNFNGVEGFEDHSVNIMYFWDKKGALCAVLVNVSCPSQEVEHLGKINADFWHPVREKLQKEYGKQLCVVGLCGAAGDLSPHLLFNKAADRRMANLAGKNRLEMIADRIVNAVTSGLNLAVKDKKGDASLKVAHAVVDLPQRKIPKEVYDQLKVSAANSKRQADAAADKGASGPYTIWHWTQGVLDRYEQQQKEPNASFAASIHAVRLGDTVLCSNPFELYSDYAAVMKARSKAVQTFVAQLTDAGSGGSGYLPTARAVSGGGYGAIPESNAVGPEGGRILTEKTIELINSLF